MEMSENTNELFTAFSKFQGELDNSSKSKQGHGYNYSDLATCINTAKPILASNGLSVTQMMGMSEGSQTIITMLAHSSGQWMRSETIMPNATLQGSAGKNPVQVLGSAITYMRRYCYAAITGMAQEDDDGAANTRQQSKSGNQSNTKQVDQAKLKTLQQLIESKGYTVQQVCETWGIQSLTETNLDQAIKKVQGWK